MVGRYERLNGTVTCGNRTDIGEGNRPENRLGVEEVSNDFIVKKLFRIRLEVGEGTVSGGRKSW